MPFRQVSGLSQAVSFGLPQDVPLTTGVCWQTPFEQESLVHEFPSSQSIGVFEHVPPLHRSVVQRRHVLEQAVSIGLPQAEAFTLLG